MSESQISRQLCSQSLNSIINMIVQNQNLGLNPQVLFLVLYQ